jgi:hypothetical protein
MVAPPPSQFTAVRHGEGGIALLGARVHAELSGTAMMSGVPLAALVGQNQQEQDYQGNSEYGATD